jgi:hypothetical protein
MEKPRRKHVTTERIPTHIPTQDEAVLEQLKEEAFRSIILHELTENFEENLANAEFSEEEIREVENEIAQLSFEDATKVFSIPHDVAPRKFNLLRERVDKGQIEAKDIPKLLIEEAQRYGFGIGYHNSSAEIKPNKNGEWFIKPTEADHRDNDLAKAYFATTYKTLYRKGGPRFMYIVRTIAENTKTDGNWSRSNGMSVITSVPVDRIDGWVSRVAREKENAAQEGAAFKEREAA